MIEKIKRILKAIMHIIIFLYFYAIMALILAQYTFYLIERI